MLYRYLGSTNYLINSDLKKTIIKDFLKWLCMLCVLHVPSVVAAENLFECRTDVIEGSAASAFLAIHDSGKASLDWFDQKSTKLMSCHLSIVEGKYSARAHTNDIIFEFKKDACESVQKDIDSHLDVMNEGFLKISTRSTSGYISHLLMFYHAQPIACDIQHIDRKQLELLAIEYNPFKQVSDD